MLTPIIIMRRYFFYVYEKIVKAIKFQIKIFGSAKTACRGVSGTKNQWNIFILQPNTTENKVEEIPWIPAIIAKETFETINLVLPRRSLKPGYYKLVLTIR